MDGHLLHTVTTGIFCNLNLLRKSNQNMKIQRRRIVHRLCILGAASILSVTNEMPQVFVCGTPTFLVDAARQRCISIDAAQDTILKIFYEAPGMCDEFILHMCIV
jgi:hypothetical protein